MYHGTLRAIRGHVSSNYAERLVKACDTIKNAAPTRSGMPPDTIFAAGAGLQSRLPGFTRTLDT